MKKIQYLILIFLFGLNIFITPNIYAYPFWGHPSRYKQEHAFWYRLRDSFRLDHYTYKSSVSEQIRWFQYNQAYLHKILANAAPYLYYIYTQVKKHNLPGELALLPVIESAYDPFAYSDRGAAGLWQLMPGTATGYGLKQDWWYDGRRDIYASTDAALSYLTYLGNFFNDNWLYAIAAYDAGEGTVQQAIDNNARYGYSTSFWNLPLPNETHAYVPRLLALAAIISDPSRYGINLPAIKDGPYFAVVKVGTQIDLAHAAKLAHISLKKLYELNPGYNRWATDPNGPYRLLLPVDKIAEFKHNLAKIPESKRVTWNRYRVKRGDSLNRIAKHFKTRVYLLEEINKLSDNLITPGQILLIPRNTNELAHYDFTPELKYASSKQLKIGPKKIKIKVHVGDSLWKFANKYHLKISQIRFWNHLSKGEPLKVGGDLILWVPRKSHIPNSIPDQKVDLTRNYKVKKGDSLSSIANQLNVTVGKIKALNHLKSNTIHIGQRLKIPPIEINKMKKQSVKQNYSIHYRVKKGDSLSKIAAKYHVSLTDLRQWNHKKLGEYLQIGQELKIYK